MKRALALLLGALLLAGAAAGETDWCKKQRKKCEAGCPKSARVKFDCKDEDGARSVACSCISADGHTLSSSSSSSGGSTFGSSSSSFSSSSSAGAPLPSMPFDFADGWPWGGEDGQDGGEKPAAGQFQRS